MKTQALPEPARETTPQETEQVKEAGGLPPPKPVRLQLMIDEIVWYNGADPLLWPSAIFLGLAAKGITVKMLTKHRLDIAKYNCLQQTKKRLTKSRLGSPLDQTFSPETVLGPDEEKEKEVLRKLMRLKELRKQQNDNGNSGVGFATIFKETAMSAIGSSLQVKESDFRSALSSLGVEGVFDVRKWPLKRLNQKVADAEAFSSLLESLAKAGSVPEGADKDLLSNISDTLSESREVKVIGDRVHDSGNSTNEESSMSTATATKKKPSGKPAEKKGLKKGSLMSAAITVMKAKKSKTHWKPAEVYAEIERKGLWKPEQGKTPVATLSASMYKEVKDKEGEARFIKTEGGFALNPNHPSLQS